MTKITKDTFDTTKRKNHNGIGFTNSENVTRAALLSPETKIAVLADIHGNLHALQSGY